ncbi:MAG: DMT family transporter [Lachnospiraceae bacterium]|jgi:transporter family-2 protein|nr:DMT family transporter [Lachnospiraceae bacterium]
MFGILISLLSGALMSIQGVFNSEVTKQTSVWVSAGWVQLTAFVTCVALWLFTGRQQVTGLFAVSPWYMLTGGIIGAFITYTVIQGMSLLGPARSVMLIVVSQLLVAYLIEAFGLFGVDKVAFEWRRVIGMGLAVIGIIIFKW